MKKLLCVVLSVVLFVSCFVFAVSASSYDDYVNDIISNKWNLGDVDLDDNITAADARLALRAAVGLEHYEKGSKQYNAADYNQDGEITASDARCILRVSVDLCSEDMSKEELEKAIVQLYINNGVSDFQLDMTGTYNRLLSYMKGDTWVTEFIYPSSEFTDEEYAQMKYSFDTMTKKTYERTENMIELKMFRELSGLKSATRFIVYKLDDGRVLWQGKIPYSEELMR